MSAAVDALRGYQLRAVEGVRDAFGRVRRVLLALPTGAGKTHTAAELIARAWARGRRVWFIVHRREIALDTWRRLVARAVPCGLMMADEPVTDAPVQVVMVQTLTARGTRVTLGKGDLVVWDECHHCEADTYRAVAEQCPETFHLGLTATPERGDGAGLRDAFDEIVAPITSRELVALGVLAPVDVKGPRRRQSRLSMSAFEAWGRWGRGRPTVAFCESIPASLALVDALTEQGVAAAHLDGSTPTRRREQILEDFDAGRLDVISNVFVLAEGWDCARVEVILLARGCGSAATFVQIIGRGRRLGDNPHKRCTLVDLCGAVWQHGMPDADREMTLDGVRSRPAAEDGDGAIAQCPECGEVYEVAGYARACPNGHERPGRPVREVKRAPVGDIATVVSREELQAEFDRLMRLARERGWSPKAAPTMFWKRFGFWPVRMRESRRAA